MFILQMKNIFVPQICKQKKTLRCGAVWQKNIKFYELLQVITYIMRDEENNRK